MNEFDGNLTLWSDAGNIELNHNKVRGPEFEPRYFRIELLGSPEILDNKGRQPQLPILRPISEQTVEERKKADGDVSRGLLRQMRDNPTGSQQDWANAIKRTKGRVNQLLKGLAGEGLAKSVLGAWSITQKGENEINGGAKRLAA